MKMIRAVIRPEREEDVISRLTAAGLPAFTKVDVLGRGRQKGVQVGNTVYDELSKTMLMIVVEDDKAPAAIEAIRQGALTGNPGDGKVVVTAVDSVMTIRTGKNEL
jgi:nitrogen regulatory protein PII 1